MNSIGKRTSISPIHKGKMLLGSLLASYIIQLLGITLLFIFTIFVLKVDYGNNLLLVVLLAICGSLAGLSLGVMVATTIKSNENSLLLFSIIMFIISYNGLRGQKYDNI